jgi:endonuclease-3 related protein
MLHKIHDRLLREFGPQHWWPAETDFEVIVGAILTQNTAWKNVKQSIGALRQNGILNFEGIHEIPVEELAPLIRSSGYYNQKAKKLKEFCNHLANRWQGDLAFFLSREMEPLRLELLTIRGIGPETADSIILYAAHQPSFVVDSYTYRIFSRHGRVYEDIGYEELRSYFMDSLEPDVAFFGELHALLVHTGHLFCRKKPSCGACPLNGWTEE